MPYLQFWLGARGPKGAPDCGVNGALMGGGAFPVSLLSSFRRSAGIPAFSSLIQANHQPPRRFLVRTLVRGRKVLSQN